MKQISGDDISKKVLAQKQAQPAKRVKKLKRKKCQKTKVARRFEPRTWVSPARCFATGVAIHPLSLMKQK